MIGFLFQKYFCKSIVLIDIHDISWQNYKKNMWKWHVFLRVNDVSVK